MASSQITPRMKTSSCRSIKQRRKKMWLLEVKTQWLEKHVKEDEDKPKQIEAARVAAKEVTRSKDHWEDE